MEATFPTLFIGHGSPMDALRPTRFSSAWRALAERLPSPRAVVAISAHWETKGVLITGAAHPRTIHDFYGFPPEFYAVTYPAPGDPGLAAEIETLLGPFRARADLDGWGLDHGTWTVLRWMYPNADIPVLQVSLDVRRTAAEHFAIGRALGALPDQGMLILGSGNIVHNLRAHDRNAQWVHPWAKEFDDWVLERVAAGDDQSLINYRDEGGAAGRLAVPESEHFLPLLYVLGARRAGESVQPFTQEVFGALSMTSFAIGLPQAA